MRMEFDVTITTPLMIGGYGSKELGLGGMSQDEAQRRLTAEGMRVPSLRGAMRFWFRALAGRITSDLKAIRRAETRVFGGTAGDATRSAVRIQCWPTSDILVEQYGVRMNKPENPRRWAIQPGTKYRLVMTSYHPALLKIAVGCLWMVSNFGGVGARTRRGFGGIGVVAVPGQEGEGAWRNAGIKIEFSHDLPSSATQDLKNLESFRNRYDAASFKPFRRKVLGGIFQALNLTPTIEAIESDVRVLLGTPTAGTGEVSEIGRINLIGPDSELEGGFLGWDSWGQALLQARSSVYVPFKNALHLAHIGSPSPRSAANDRRVGGTGRFASPLCLKVLQFSQSGHTRFAILATVLMSNWHEAVGLRRHLSCCIERGDFTGAPGDSLLQHWNNFVSSAVGLNGHSIVAESLEAWAVL